MTSFEFEDLIGHTYGRLGYEVVHRGGPRSDGGVDLELRRAGERVLVQCKYWKAWKVGVKPVREFWGVVSSEGATRGLFITTATYSSAAKEFARGQALELLDGPAVIRLIEAANRATEIRPVPPATPQVAPACPLCRQPMVRRTARRGPNAGRDFWGCSTFPKCSGTLPDNGLSLGTP